MDLNLFYQIPLEIWKNHLFKYWTESDKNLFSLVSKWSYCIITGCYSSLTISLKYSKRKLKLEEKHFSEWKHIEHLQIISDPFYESLYNFFSIFTNLSELILRGS